jgi:branched-chain amino acid aminotransferase
MRIYVDGKLYGKDDARVSVFDHGFLYGDGVFEGIRVYDGCVFRLKEHLQRLYASAKTLCLEIPLSYEEMRQAVMDTVAANEARDAYIRLVVSRGAGDLGIDPANCAKPTVVIIVGGIKLYPPELHEKGVTLITSSLRRIPLDSLDPRIKSLNYMNNILAKIEAKRAGAHEAVLLNHQGLIAECSADNLFLVTRGVLQTPDLIHGALPGITRACVLELAGSLGIPAVQCALAMHDVYNADEAFVTGTGAEIVAAVSADGRKIGDGRPGPITRKLVEAFRHARTRDGAKVVYAGAV